MPKYLMQANYTPEGVKGLVKDGGSGRKSAVAEFIKQVDGKMESFYFSFGETDVWIIAELPGSAAAAALSLAVTGAGAVRIKTTVLITPEEMDVATKSSVKYTPPGRLDR